MAKMKTCTHDECVTALRKAADSIKERADDIIGDIKLCRGYTVTIEIQPDDVVHYIVEKDIIVEDKEDG